MAVSLRKHPVMALVAVLLALLLAWGFWPRPVLVEVASASRAPMTVTIEEEGRTRVIDRYVITAPVDGVACRLHLDVGDAVEQGEVLLGITPMESPVLDPRSRARAQANVAAAESALHAAREEARAAAAAAELALKERERLRPLLSRGTISRDDFDRAFTESQTATARRQSADFAVDVARYELQAARSVLEIRAGAGGDPAERLPVSSPVTGRILKVAHECEGPVRTGTSLLEVGDPSQLEVEVDVLSADAVRIRPGMPVRFDRWGGEAPLEGIVRLVEPVGFTKISALGVEEQRVLVISDFTSPPEQWRRLGDGYRVEAQFILWHEEDVLQVPASSLFRHGDGWALFVVEDGRARLREIRIGERNGLTAQILEPLEAGDRVINHPGDDVEDGRRVALRGNGR